MINVNYAIKSGHLVAELVEALCYKPKVAGSIPNGVLRFFIDLIIPAALVPWVDSASDRNEYPKFLLGVKAVGP